MGRERILIAMSGGVDSAVAAARLVDQGYDVVGVTLHLWDYPDEGPGAHGRCCAPEDQYDARRTADALGIPHFTFDRRELFERTVVAPFVEAYLAGETPSPCTACNRGVKIAELVAIADRLGAARIATGHYARLGHDADGTPFLREGRDPAKDQSYFLYATPPAQLERLAFPLGESLKPEVRAEALARGIPGAAKGESQELCFVGAGAGAYASFVEQRAKGRVRPGPVVDEEGRVVGQHEGIHRFTIGQRKGLGIAVGHRTFVTAIDVDTGTVHLGSGAPLHATVAELDDLVLAPGVTLPREARIRVRYRHEGAAAHVTAREGARAVARFTEPVRAVSPGQVAVFYEGDRVLGGARITAAAESQAAAAHASEPRAAGVW
ncbi:MAG: tRNA-specific 2-thiouridylase MnmA [Labilithrix sp.]|nr:tRNA-specific 2-thiouridylase MnmA [Labilithrix sp.]